MAENKDDRGAKGLYFTHDSDAHNDHKIVQMLSVYGFLAYGWYWRVLEQMRKLPGFRLRVGGKYGIQSLSRMLNEDATTVEQWVDDCCNEFKDALDGTGLFTRDGEFIFSDSFMRRMNRMEKIRETNSRAGKASAQKRIENQLQTNDRSTGVEPDANLLKSKLKSKSNTESHTQTKRKVAGKFIWEDEIVRDHEFWKSPEFQESWEAYRVKRESKKYDLTARSAKTLLNELILLSAGNLLKAIHLVDMAENGGWKFIYDRKDSTGTKNNGTGKTGFVNDAYNRVADSIT